LHEKRKSFLLLVFDSPTIGGSQTTDSGLGSRSPPGIDDRP
jgi:hypothetical protein